MEKKDSVNTENRNYIETDDMNKLLQKARHAVAEKDTDSLEEVDRIITTHFCKRIANNELEKLSDLNTLLGKFLGWFECNGEVQWNEALLVANRWKTLLEFSQRILITANSLKTYQKLKASSYGMDLVKILIEKKIMKPVEIQEALHINTIQQVSNLLSDYEKAGIITREIYGKNVWVSLGKQGMAVYLEYIQPRERKEVPTEFGQAVVAVLKDIENSDYSIARERLDKIRQKSQNDSFVLCLLGMIAIEEGNVVEAGELFAEAVRDGLDKIRAFMFFFLLEKMEKLNSLGEGIAFINTQKDDITWKICESLHILGLLWEYKGEFSRANEYYRLSNMCHKK